MIQCYKETNQTRINNYINVSVSDIIIQKQLNKITSQNVIFFGIIVETEDNKKMRKTFENFVTKCR